MIATSALKEGLDVPDVNAVICYCKIPTSLDFTQYCGRARQEDSQILLFENDLDEFEGGIAIAEKSEQHSWAKVERSEHYPYRHPDGEAVIDFLSCSSILARYINDVTPPGKKMIHEQYVNIETDPTVMVPAPQAPNEKDGYLRVRWSDITKKKDYQKLCSILSDILRKRSSGKSILSRSGKKKMLDFFICTDFAREGWIQQDNLASDQVISEVRKNCTWETNDTHEVILRNSFDNNYIDEFSNKVWANS